MNFTDERVPEYPKVQDDPVSSSDSSNSSKSGPDKMVKALNTVKDMLVDLKVSQDSLKMTMNSRLAHQDERIKELMA